MGADGQEISIVYDARDMRSLYGACRKCRRILILVASVPLLIGMLNYLKSPQPTDFWIEVLVSIFLGAGLAGAVYFFSPALQIWQRRKSGWDQPMMVHLTKDGIATRHPTQDAQFHWSAIKEVVTKKRRLFLFTTPACAIILPRRCFESDAQFNDWAERAHRYFHAAQPAVAL